MTEHTRDTTAVLLRLSKELLQRVEAHQAKLEALVGGIHLARNDVLVSLITKGLEAFDAPAPAPRLPIPVSQEPVVPAPDISLGQSPTRRKNALALDTLRAIAAARQQQPTLSHRGFAAYLFESGIYRSEARDGHQVPASTSLVHRWLQQAREAGLLP